LDGWTVGTGVEWELDRSLVLGLEYNFVNLRGADFSTMSSGAAPGIPLVINLDDLDVHTVMARPSYKFDREREVVPLN
jgi:opacity protein-like surface antigen